VTGDIPRESAHAARMVGLPHGARCDVAPTSRARSFARSSTRAARSSAGSNPNCRRGRCRGATRMKDGRGRRITGGQRRRRRMPNCRQRVTMPRMMTSPHRSLSPHPARRPLVRQSFPILLLRVDCQRTVVKPVHIVRGGQRVREVDGGQAGVAVCHRRGRNRR
jgi:hypothetical protein